MDNLFDEPIVITLPPKRVSRRNYRHPARLYARAARLNRSYFGIERLIKIANGPADSLEDLMRRNMACVVLSTLHRAIS